MMIIKKYRKRNRLGATRMTVQEDIAKLLSHDWSDPLLDHFTRVVEKLSRKPHPPLKKEDEEEEAASARMRQ